MGNLTILALRIVLAMVLAGSLFVQAVMVPLLATDLNEDFGSDVAHVSVPLIVITVLGIVTIQVTVICVWRLVTMVRRGTVFSHAAFRYVDVVIGAVAAASLLTFGLGVVLAPGATVALGVVLLIGGLAVIVAGIALIVLVMRMLLAQGRARRRGEPPAGRAGRGDLMPIVVDVDVMLAVAQDVRGRARGTRRDHPRQPCGAQERSCQGGALHDARGAVRGTRRQPGDLLRWEPGTHGGEA